MHMREKKWPISKVEKEDLCLIGIPQRIGTDKLYSKDSYNSFPTLESTVGEDWESLLLSTLLEKERLLAWWTSTTVFKKSGLRNYRTGRLPDLLDITNPLEKIYIRRFPFRGNILVVTDASDHTIRQRINSWSGGDTEMQPEFICSAPTTAHEWQTKAIADWCRSNEKWSDPTCLMPSHVHRIIALFDGDIYCASTRADAEDVMASLHDLADSWEISIITGPDEYSWLSFEE